MITVNVDDAPSLAEAFKVQAMPTFLVIKGKWNNVIETVVGGGQPNVNKAFQTAVDKKWYWFTIYILNILKNKSSFINSKMVEKTFSIHCNDTFLTRIFLKFLKSLSILNKNLSNNHL